MFMHHAQSETCPRSFYLFDRIDLIAATLCVFALALFFRSPVFAQDFEQLGGTFTSLREVTVVGGAQALVAVVEFPSHGQIDREKENFIVLTQKMRRPVAARLLQIGPGDFCRLAFELMPNQTSYEIYYGGEGPDKEEIPEWGFNGALLLETREYTACNMNDLDSVKTAFQTAAPIGANYVDGVHDSYNPFRLAYKPFMSLYKGKILIPQNGPYSFYTSSRDCSFLLIDEQLVASAPGRHGPQRQATPTMRNVVPLSPGTHDFEYYHVASSGAATMVAAWEVGGGNAKPKPETIPPELFGVGLIASGRAGPLATPDSNSPPDFAFRVSGDVPLPDNPSHLIGVEFRLLTTSAGSVPLQWDFGDGQTSDRPNPIHVFMKPGLYPVTLTIIRGEEELSITNEVEVDIPRLPRNEEVHQIDDYLLELDGYDPKAYEASNLLQYVEAYLWKADMLLEKADALETAAAEFFSAPPDPEAMNNGTSTSPRENPALIRAEAATFQGKAVAAGSVAFQEGSTLEDDQAVMQLVHRIAPLARDVIGDYRLTGKLWFYAAQMVEQNDNKAECLARAADIAVNDMLSADAAKTFLETAEATLGSQMAGELPALIQLVWGDYYAATGDGEQARTAYREAARLHVSQDSYLAQTAWRGAYSRSAEQFLKNGHFDRAIIELRNWRDDFPEDAVEGYWTLLFARYWQSRKRHDQAVALADRLLVVNPQSPYVDQILMTAIECELERESEDSAKAILLTLIREYPGSPLIPKAKAMLERLESESP
jgi:TolA-binding protein